MNKNTKRGLWHVYQAPLFIGVISFAGLLFALLVEGNLLDWVWSMTASAPIIVILVMMLKARWSS